MNQPLPVPDAESHFTETLRAAAITTRRNSGGTVIELRMALLAYLDNVVVSGRTLRDLVSSDPTRLEMRATDALYEARNRHELDLCTSREAHREQERTTNENKRALLAAHRGNVPVVQRDHEVLGFSLLTDPFGTSISSPLVSDVVDSKKYDGLRAIGVRSGDAKHIVNAFANGCARFVTTDTRDILPKKAAIENLCPGLTVVRPTELAIELNLEY